MAQTNGSNPAASVADALWELFQIDTNLSTGSRPGPERRNALVEQIGPPLMHRYLYNREVKTLPVLKLEGGTCPQCHTHYAASHAIMQMADSGKVAGCHTCGSLITFVKVS